MDSQNANGGFAPQNNILPNDDAAKESVIVKPDNYVNIQTQSVVQSSREMAKEELDKLAEQQRLYEQQQRLDKAITGTKKTTAYLVVGIIALAILIGIIWIIVNAVKMGARTPVGRGGENGNGGNSQSYGEIDGYTCKTNDCSKTTEISDTKFLVRDGGYYIYDTESEEAMLTTITNQAYHEIKIFTWGSRTLAVLDPESGLSALYSITENRQISSFSYDDFLTESEEGLYDGNLASKQDYYIIAKNSSGYRLIDLYNGTEVAYGSASVSAEGSYGFGKDTDGQIHIFANGQPIKSFSGNKAIYVYKGYVVACEGDYTPEVFDTTGIYSNGASDISNEIQQAAQNGRNYGATVTNLGGVYIKL